MLGYEYDVSTPIDWHQDPRSEYRWERGFYADLRLDGLPDGVDVKYVWELGRQQYVVELARGWWLESDDRFARGARDIVLNWISENPLYEGIHWSSALEVAMRAMSWIWMLATLAEWDGWQDEDVTRIAGSMAEHAAYLEYHLEFYSSPYNHLIGEATALYLLGLVLQGHEPAERWKQTGRDVLCEHGPKQFYADGFCVEQATGYHFYTLGFLLTAIAAARRTGEPLRDLEPVVHRAARAGAAFRQPDGRWPAIGDIDSARSIPVHHEDFWRFDSLCNLAAVLFDDADLKTDSEDPGAELYWLLGCEGIERWKRLEGKSAESQVVLKGSGYVIARDETNWLLFDAGSIAGGLFPDSTPSTAHGHADTLQVLYFADGRPLLQDGGMPFYNGETDWVRHFRSPGAHNTVAIEGCEYVRPVGRLAWSHEVQRPTLDAEFTNNVWRARGRVEWPGVILERHLLCVPGTGLWIADWIQSDRERECRWFWQVPRCENTELEASDAGRASAAFDEFSIDMTTTARRLDASLQNAGGSRPEGWRCPGYGVREAATRMVVKQVVAGEVLVLTSVGDSCRNVDVTVEASELRVGRRGNGNPRTVSYSSGSIRWSVQTAAIQQQGFVQSQPVTTLHD